MNNNNLIEKRVRFEDDDEEKSRTNNLKKFYLDKEQSMRYYKGEIDLKRLRHGMIQEPEKQLCLDLSDSHIAIAKPIVAYAVDLSNSSWLRDVSALGNITKLSLRNCYNVKDVSQLGNVYDIDLSFTGVVNISKLKAKRINLEGTRVRDVSSIFNNGFKWLNVKRCKYIKDTSQIEKTKNCPPVYIFTGVFTSKKVPRQRIVLCD